MDIKALSQRFKNKYRDEIILGLAEDDEFEVKCIPTGLIGVDYVIGRPGIPAFKLTQICGFEDSGKSLLGLHLLISFQKRYENGIPILIDTEYAFDPGFFKALGGDTDRIIVITPKSIEEIFEVVRDIAKEVRDTYGEEPHIFFLIDSISTATLAELDGDAPVGTHARILHKEFRKTRANLPKWNATLVYISQNREKISMTPWGARGSTRLGGHAVDFAPVLTLEMKKVGVRTNSKGEPLFVDFKVKCLKNHISIPFREQDLVFDLHNYKFWNGYNIARILIATGKISKNKGWYEFEGQKYREKDLYELFDNPEWEDKIRQELNIAYDQFSIL